MRSYNLRKKENKYALPCMLNLASVYMQTHICEYNIIQKAENKKEEILQEKEGLASNGHDSAKSKMLF